MGFACHPSASAPFYPSTPGRFDSTFGLPAPSAGGHVSFHVVSHHLDALLRVESSRACFIPETGSWVRPVASGQRLLSTNVSRTLPPPFPATQTPFEVFPSSAAEPRHRDPLPSCRYPDTLAHSNSLPRRRSGDRRIDLPRQLCNEAPDTTSASANAVAAGIAHSVSPTPPISHRRPRRTVTVRGAATTMWRLPA
jgi:hypothetical protein